MSIKQGIFVFSETAVGFGFDSFVFFSCTSFNLEIMALPAAAEVKYVVSQQAVPS